MDLIEKCNDSVKSELENPARSESTVPTVTAPMAPPISRSSSFNLTQRQSYTLLLGTHSILPEMQNKEPESFLKLRVQGKAARMV